jgi:hypothetical protein
VPRRVEDAAYHYQRAEYSARHGEDAMPPPPGRATGRGVLMVAGMLRLRLVPLPLLSLIAGWVNRRELTLMRVLVVLGLRHFAPIVEKIESPSVPNQTLSVRITTVM